jgi:YfiH family protein
VTRFSITAYDGIVGLKIDPGDPVGPGGKIRRLFTTKKATVKGGAFLDFDHRKGDHRVVRESYEAAARWFGVNPSSIFVMRQVHGSDVLVLCEVPDPSRMRAAVPVDAVVTNRKGLVLTVLTADCLPILLVDPVRGVIAAVHAGWRSSVAGIARKAVDTMASAFGAVSADISAALGPAIGKCCFEVGPEVVVAVREAFGFGGNFIEMKANGKGMLDLVGLNRAVLMEAGVNDAAIETADLCTYDNDDLFHSYRREGEGTGRMLAGIMIQE